MFLVSWNVAAWTTTTAAIRGAFGSLESFLQKLDADILCLQETKIGKKKLDADEVSCGAADRPGFPIAGYESFWCYCTEKGMNGVCTFVRSGLTHRVDARPFGDDTLDNEGRCIVTYHSHFTLFNVYVPNSRGGDRQAYKTRFLTALKGAMNRAREETKRPVILVGDMNFTYRTEDCHFSNRKLCLQSLATALRVAACNGEENSATAAEPVSTSTAPNLYSKRHPLHDYEVEMLIKCIPLLHEHVVQKLGRPTYLEQQLYHDAATILNATSSPEEVQRRTRYLHAAAERVDVLRQALRANHEQQQFSSKNNKNVTSNTTTTTAAEMLGKGANRNVTGNGGSDDEVNHTDEGNDENGSSTSAFRDYVWVDSLIRGSPNAINERNEILYLTSECVGVPCHHRGDAEFAISLLTDPIHPMIDTFTEFTEVARTKERSVNLLRLPGCPRRTVMGIATPGPGEEDSAAVVMTTFPQPFTCWDQYRNKRYDNEGNRIDYVFVDASLLQQVDCVTVAPPPHSSDINTINSSSSTMAPIGSSACDNVVASQISSTRDTLLSGLNGPERRAGLVRATANGRYSAAPTSGGGMEKLRDVDKFLMFQSSSALQQQQNRHTPPHIAQQPQHHRNTGLLITPPQFSDHIGVTIVLEPRLLPAAAHGITPTTTTTTKYFLVPRDAGKAVLDPSGVLFRRKSGNLMSMFAKKAAVAAATASASVAAVQPNNNTTASSSSSPFSDTNSSRKRERDQEAHTHQPPPATTSQQSSSSRNVEVIIVVDD
ncbi:apurinic apyrimidinic endonuclease, putative [Bodo saltans]|uniref:Apurinic apyrimidinic endonuclease, putative n=1 Tax=Bodo saltans TaxID=75058 RepID=A0A0S4KDR1_BODSA|nr:apurinic apyrimidinic endonuclease, putative [Bodo saltans]|eukprot:CUI10896.1 apurinic apyrimidinic endonuclease, putative [Bodo saltans]